MVFDPSEHRKQEKLIRKISREDKFEVVAKEWYSRNMEGKFGTRQERTSRLLEKDLIPYLKGRPIGEITPPELKNLYG